jgi:hypothetical protein
MELRALLLIALPEGVQVWDLEKGGCKIESQEDIAEVVLKFCVSHGRECKGAGWHPAQGQYIYYVR